MFSKLYSSMYDGTLGTRGPWQALVTFQQLLILSDRFGVVDMTHEAISRRTTIPLEVITEGIAALEKPDPDSRRADEDGRRIVRLADHRDWGWQITNFAHYNAIRSSAERNEYQREYMREYRRKQAGNSPQSPPDDSPVLLLMPLVDGSDFELRQSWVDQLTPLYPAVDVLGTCREMRGWLLGNPQRRKTKRGIRAFITRWLQREQDKPA